MKKNKIVKDIDLDELKRLEEEQNKKRKIKLIAAMIAVSLVGIMFLATYLRWNSDIADKHRIIYYGQDNVKIDNLVDFYGLDVNKDIDENSAIVMYCDREYGKNCTTFDNLNFMENVYRNPIIIINIVIIIDLILFYYLIKDKFMKDYKKVIIGLVILIYGLGLSFMQVYKVAEYYIFVNNKFETNATIYKKVITGNKNKYHTIVKYEIDGKEYMEYLDTDIKGNIEDKIGEEINIHYYKKNKTDIVGKRNVLWRIAPFILGTLIIIESVWFFPKKRKIVSDSNEEKDSIKK